MTQSAPIKLLPWDSDFFGFPVARLVRRQVDTAAMASARAWCRERGVRCLYYLAAADDLPSLLAAQDGGMQFIDIRLTLACSLPLPQPPRHVPAIRPATPADQQDLISLAPALAEVSRFGRDPRFGWDKAVALFEKWLLQGTAVTYIIDTPHGIGGAIRCQLNEQGSGVITLLVTNPHQLRQGHGNALCAAGLRWMLDQQCTVAQVVTQGHNVAGQRVYQHHGFITESVEVWFHQWFD